MTFLEKLKIPENNLTIAEGITVTYLATHSSILSRKGIAIDGFRCTKVESTTMHKLRVSSSNCSSEALQSGHQSRSRSPLAGSLSVLLSKVLSNERVERLWTSLDFEPLRFSFKDMEPSKLLDLDVSCSRLIVESRDTRKSLKIGIKA